MNIQSNSQMFLDIETYPIKEGSFIDEYVKNSIDKRLKDPQKIEENKAKIINKFALSPITGMISMIGIKNANNIEIILNKDIIKYDEKDIFIELLAKEEISVILFENEKLLLEYVIDLINQAVMNASIIITFNGKKFDFPFILYRALINKTTNVIYNYKEYVKPYAFEPHFDLRQLLDEGSLNEISHIINNTDYSDANGADLIEMIDNNKYYDASKKLVNDLNKTEKLFDSLKNWVSFKTYIPEY